MSLFLRTSANPGFWMNMYWNGAGNWICKIPSSVLRKKKKWKSEHECHFEGLNRAIRFFEKDLEITLLKMPEELVIFVLFLLSLHSLTRKEMNSLREGWLERFVHSAALRFPQAWTDCHFLILLWCLSQIGYHQPLMSCVFLMSTVILLTMTQGQSHIVNAENNLINKI